MNMKESETVFGVRHRWVVPTEDERLVDNKLAKDMHDDLENETDRFIVETIKNA